MRTLWTFLAQKYSRSLKRFYPYLSPIKTQLDYIIIGQGFAGSALALELSARGKKIMVIDEPDRNLSSRVAAGMVNPFASKGLIKTWMAETIFPHLHSFYASAERLLQTNFFFPALIYRPFLTIEEQNHWIATTSDPSIAYFVDATFTTSTYGNQIHDPLGGIVARWGGYLDANLYLDSVRNWLVDLESFRGKRFNISELNETEAGVSYQDIHASKAIFCTGIPTASDFGWLPVIKLKGEVLQIKLNEVPDLIYNRGVYAVASGQPMIYKAGSTYQLKNITEGITEAGRNELEIKLKQLFKLPFETVGQDWGLRPTTIDRKPVLGYWPGFENRIIFNGLGTKGVSLAPYFSGVLADWLEGKIELKKEVNIKRFKALYS